MKFASLKILSPELLKPFKLALPKDFQKHFSALRESPLSTRTFSFYNSVSAIASSRIEGEVMEMDSYLKYKMLKVKYLPELVRKPNDLFAAYVYAQSHGLSPKSFSQAHKLLSAHLLPPRWRGKLRKGEMVILEQPGQGIQYEAAPAKEVPRLYAQLWGDIEFLKHLKMTSAEAFFFASHIHLTFVKIHPFEDGNGRAARLLEKWFLAEKLGPKAWYLQSELYYYQNVARYYANLTRLGLFFSHQDYSKALPFFQMLTKSLEVK